MAVLCQNQSQCEREVRAMTESRSKREQIKAVAEPYPVANLRIFDTGCPDELGIIVDALPEATLFDLGGFRRLWRPWLVAGFDSQRLLNYRGGFETVFSPARSLCPRSDVTPSLARHPSLWPGLHPIPDLFALASFARSRWPDVGHWRAIATDTLSHSPGGVVLDAFVGLAFQPPLIRTLSV